MMIGRAFLPLFALFLVSCAPIIKPLEPTATEPAPTASPAPSMPTLTAAAAAYQVTAMQSLNVRQFPGETARVIGYLYHGDRVTLTGTCRTGWAEIEWRGATAWVKASFLSKNKCSEEQ